MAVIAKRDSTLRLEALDHAAEALGLEAGLPLAAARARVPELQVVDADPPADLAFLAAIGEACRRYTPAFALDPPAGVHLDITGVAALFGGEDVLADDLTARMRRQGITVRIGAGPTFALAWALARHGDRTGRRGSASVRDLPVSALRLDAGSLGVLHGLGLRRVGQVLDIPRATLGRRLGDVLLQRLDETLGLRGPALNLVPERVPFHVQHRLAEPIALEVQILSLCRWLAARLAEKLEQRRVGGRTFLLHLFRVDGEVKQLAVQSSRPLRDPARITALFTERIAVLNDGLEADFGFDLVRLTAEDVQSIGSEVLDFVQGSDDRDLAALVDRYAVRLGADAVMRLTPAPESRIPENAVKTVPFASKAAWSDEAAAVYDDILLRPLTLFSPPHPIEVIAGVPEDPPRQFQWRRQIHVIVRAEGPERIAWEWRLGAEPDPVGAPSPGVKPVVIEQQPDFPGEIERPDQTFRDYYRVEDADGRRFWVYREGAVVAGTRARWFLHGLFP